MHVGAVLVSFVLAAVALCLTLLTHIGPVAAVGIYAGTFGLVLGIWSAMSWLRSR